MKDQTPILRPIVIDEMDNAMTRYVFTAVILTFAIVSQAQEKSLPYKARVIKHETYARSGAGERFYPTQALKKDTIVTVKRHEPGGWFLIEPPEGSFSWIPEKHVRQTTSSSGEVIRNNAVVFVGSSFGDETNVWQRQLMAGEKVSIIGRREVDTLSGVKKMLKIKPPSREYRWIRGTDVIPEGEQQREAHDRNPYNVPSGIAKRHNEPEKTVPEAGTPSTYSPSRQLARLQEIRKEQRRLREIDLSFRKMILGDPSTWNLKEIEDEYRQLQESATYKPVAGQIDLRYPAIRRYEQRKAQLDELNELTSATERKDAELLAQQYGSPGTTTVGLSGSGFGSPALVGAMTPQSPFTFDGDNVVLPAEGGLLPPIEQFGTLPVDSPNPARTFSAQGEEREISVAANGEVSGQANDGGLTVPAGSRYVGAGFIARGTGEGDPKYLLRTQSGKILAHLQPKDSIDLESMIGKSVGLHGTRFFDDKIKADRIEVSGLEAVRLR